jgi:hypothetical protein
MEIFKSLSEIKDAKVTTSVVSENVYPEINGELVIKKGILSISINYWGRVSKMRILKNYISAEDFDFETNNTTIEGMVIDNFSKFRQGLLDHGMQSVADSLTISNDEIRSEITKVIPNHKFYKLLFADAPLFDNLTFEEQKLAYVNAIREDNTILDRNEWLKRKFGWVNEDNQSLTTEEVLELYKPI